MASQIVVRLDAPTGRYRLSLPTDAALSDLHQLAKEKTGVDIALQFLALDREGLQCIVGDSGTRLGECGIGNGTQVFLRVRSETLAAAPPVPSSSKGYPPATTNEDALPSVSHRLEAPPVPATAPVTSHLELIVASMAGTECTIRACSDDHIATVAEKARQCLGLSSDDEGVWTNPWLGTWAYLISDDWPHATDQMQCGYRFQIIETENKQLKFHEIIQRGSEWSAATSISGILNHVGVSIGGELCWDGDESRADQVHLQLRRDGCLTIGRDGDLWRDNFLAKRVSAAQLCVLMKECSPLPNAGSLQSAGVEHGDRLSLCVTRDPGIPYDDHQQHIQHLEYRSQLFEQALRTAPPVLLRHNLSSEAFGHELARGAAKTLLFGGRVDGRLKLHTRRGLMVLSEERSWHIFRERGAHGRIIWRHDGCDADDRWQSVEEFVEFWAVQTELSVAAYTAHVVKDLDLKMRDPALAECRFTGTLKQTDLHRLAQSPADRSFWHGYGRFFWHSHG